ncbi:uncharacterized protein A4U43_C04F26350 [Asparagus officinalis]|uniref:Uncharacterized protein n=1 Tax=Asparagus officinalis TaxID=4686 RepID=A0A5P1F3T7_ASPOF|nr:uncharacterized protein A4U43_C04F26350 [Asparagus officinalis]
MLRALRRRDPERMSRAKSRAVKLRRADVEEFEAARRRDPERVSRSSRPLGGVIRSGVEGKVGGKVEGKVEESGVEADRRRDPERCRGQSRELVSQPG